MPVDNNLHKAAHKGDLEECQKYIEGSVEDDIEPIDINEPGAADRRALVLFIYFIITKTS